jgi:hypothetical protein
MATRKKAAPRKTVTLPAIFNGIKTAYADVVAYLDAHPEAVAALKELESAAATAAEAWLLKQNAQPAPVPSPPAAAA